MSGALDLPDTAAISVVTLGELRGGVLLATNATARATRQARYTAVRNAFAPLPIDEAVAESYGEVLAGARTAKRITTATDLLIIATAAATGRALFTFDERQAKLATALGIAVSN